jgi:hypothetical protein
VDDVQPRRDHSRTEPYEKPKRPHYAVINPHLCTVSEDRVCAVKDVPPDSLCLVAAGRIIY